MYGQIHLKEWEEVTTVQGLSWLRMDLWGVTMYDVKHFDFLLVFNSWFDELLMNTFREDLNHLYSQLSFIIVMLVIFLWGVPKMSLCGRYHFLQLSYCIGSLSTILGLCNPQSNGLFQHPSGLPPAGQNLAFARIAILSCLITANVSLKVVLEEKYWDSSSGKP